MSRKSSVCEEEHISSDPDAMHPVTPCDCYSVPITCNALLAYALNCFMKAPRDLLKKAITGFYTPEEIKDAKSVLWSAFGEHLEVFKPRRGSEKRSRQDFETDDIISAIEKLYEMNVPMNVHVSAKDLARIPPGHPGELMDFDLLTRMKELEAKLSGYQSEMESRVRELELRVTRTQPGYSDVVNRNSQYPPPPQASRAPVMSATSQSLTMPPPDLPKRAPRHPAMQSVPRQSESELSAKSNDFEIPKSHLRKQRKAAARLQGSKTPDPNSRFNGAPLPKRQVFVYRVQKPCDESDLVAHIDALNLNVGNYEVKCVSHQDAKYLSFTIDCNVNAFKVLMKEDIWPSGVCVRRYHPPPSRTQNGSAES